uniref:Uncharacterized protein n=1 Tax=Panagrolaimus davidi TaxID=227884 RepID=A0A914QE50_9BILA
MGGDILGLLCGDCNLEIDDECLQIISFKSTLLNQTLQIYAPDLPSSITLSALITFLQTTHFSQNASISLSRVYGSRHDLIIAFSPLIQLEDSDATIYDFKAIINVFESTIRLNICNLEAPSN